MISQYLPANVWAFVVATLVAVSWVEICKYLSMKGWLQAWQRRKLLHIFTGPLFILTWPLFTDDLSGAQWAAAVPLVMTLKFIAVGLGWLDDPDMILSASRNNQRSDLLKGPTLYGIIFVISTTLYWKQLQAVLCLFVLCFGDGFAEICGRAYGANNRIFYSREKSWAGFIGFVVSSLLTTWVFVAVYGQHLFGTPLESHGHLIGRIVFDCICAGIVETLPFSDIDNVTVFGAALLSDRLFSRLFLSLP